GEALPYADLLRVARQPRAVDLLLVVEVAAAGEPQRGSRDVLERDPTGLAGRVLVAIRAGRRAGGHQQGGAQGRERGARPQRRPRAMKVLLVGKGPTLSRSAGAEALEPGAAGAHDARRREGEQPGEGAHQLGAEPVPERHQQLARPALGG